MTIKNSTTFSSTPSPTPWSSWTNSTLPLLKHFSSKPSSARKRNISLPLIEPRGNPKGARPRFGRRGGSKGTPESVSPLRLAWVSKRGILFRKRIPLFNLLRTSATPHSAKSKLLFQEKSRASRKNETSKSPRMRSQSSPTSQGSSHTSTPARRASSSAAAKSGSVAAFARTSVIPGI